MSEEVAHQSEHEPVVHDEHGQDQEGYIQIVGFALGSEEFGVDISVVKEIIRMPIMTRVPNTPDFVVGVVNMRGKVIPVVDLCIRFGLPQS
jgi:purine-binding chemotaxis protein CheW